MNRSDRSERPGLYRSRNGAIFGVCRGIGEHLDMSVGGVRFIAVVLLLFTGIWPVVFIYILAALMMKPEPVIPLENDAEEEFYNSYVSSRSMALSRLKRTYENLDRRVQRIEAIVTAPDYDWERRLYERQ
jgi:phage shock protein C